MAQQTGQNLLVAIKEEVTFNAAPGATGADRLRLNASPGLSLARPAIRPGEIRADLLQPIGRLGSRSVGGSYNVDLSVDAGLDLIWQALQRGTFAAAVAITTAEVTSIAITASNTITGTGGDWLSEGLRVGDVFRLTGSANSANDNISLTVLTVTATVITCAGNGTLTPLTDDAGPDSAYTLTILKKLANPAAPTRRTFYIEEHYQDIDESLVFGGSKFATATIRGGPDAMATAEFGVVGASQSRVLTASAPFYTTPTLGANPGLVFVDAQILLGGVPLVTATAFELTMGLNAATLPIIGATVTPDVFDNTMEVSGSLSILREDLARIEAFDNETEFELSVQLEEPTGTPKKVLNFFIPKMKFTAGDAPLGDDGAMVDVLPFVAGVRASAANYDAGTLVIQTET